MKKYNLIKSRKKRVVLILGLIILSFIVFNQYQEYKTLPKVRSYTTVPVNGALDIPINWRYFAIPYENISSEEEMNRLVEVKVKPEYQYKVSFLSQKDLYLKSIATEEAKIRQEAQGRFEEFVNTHFPSDSRITIERVGQSYEPKTEYKLLVINKPFNIFYYLLGTKNKTFTFTTGTDILDEHSSRANKLKSSLGTFLATVPTKEEKERQKKEADTCQLIILDRDYGFGRNGKPQRDNINGKFYSIENSICDTVNFTGETVIVRLLDPRGKQEFEQFLRDNNVNLSLLKITYVTQ